MRSLGFSIFLTLISCTSANGGVDPGKNKSSETASEPGVAYEVKWKGKELLLDNCRLLEKKPGGQSSLLYHFKDETECHFMKGREQNVRKFVTYDERHIIPVGLSKGAIEDNSCTTKGLALLVKNEQVFISSNYYLRYDCKGFHWPEKPFHVLAAEVNLLPTDTPLNQTN